MNIIKEIINWIVKIYTEHLNNKVEKYWNIYHFDMEPNHTSYNNEGDAFKHTYMSAELTLFLGSWLAEWIGIKHEDNNPYNTPEERFMDLWNNEKGRGIGKNIKSNVKNWWMTNFDDTVALEVMTLMRKGELITSISDSRIPS